MAKQRNGDRGLYKRGNRWWLKAYLAGKGPRRVPLIPDGETMATTDKSTARVLATRYRQQLQAGPAPAPAAETDLARLVELFAAATALTASRGHVRFNVATVGRFLVERHIATPAGFTVATVQDYLGAMARTCRPGTIRNHRLALSAFGAFHVARDVLDANPCSKVRPPKMATRPPRFLDADQTEEALRLAREHGVFTEVLVALQTGLRRGELRRMRWRDVDFARRIVTVPEAKGGRFREVPLSGKCQAELEAQRKRTGDREYVFPGRDSASLSGMRSIGWWVRALDPLRESMPVFTENAPGSSSGRAWHLCRHSFASKLVQGGVPLAKVSAWLGHKSISTTQIYSHLAPGFDSDIERA